eukprot:3482881-Amphidinium_carterae.4
MGTGSTRSTDPLPIEAESASAMGAEIPAPRQDECQEYEPANKVARIAQLIADAEESGMTEMEGRVSQGT